MRHCGSYFVHVPSRLGIGIVGTLIGSLSALVGISGGSLTVPFLVLCNIPIRNAKYRFSGK